jgi:hypothetical protein
VPFWSGLLRSPPTPFCFISVNGGPAVILDQPDTGSGQTVLSVPIKLQLNNGANSVTFGANQASESEIAPVVGKLLFSPRSRLRGRFGQDHCLSTRLISDFGTLLSCSCYEILFDWAIPLCVVSTCHARDAKGCLVPLIDKSATVVALKDLKPGLHP